jgi:hypothetical protein
MTPADGRSSLVGSHPEKKQPLRVTFGQNQVAEGLEALGVRATPSASP